MQLKYIVHVPDSVIRKLILAIAVNLEINTDNTKRGPHCIEGSDWP
jgi:hypothetical protein